MLISACIDSGVNASGIGVSACIGSSSCSSSGVTASSVSSVSVSVSSPVSVAPSSSGTTGSESFPTSSLLGCDGSVDSAPLSVLASPSGTAGVSVGCSTGSASLVSSDSSLVPLPVFVFSIGRMSLPSSANTEIGESTVWNTSSNKIIAMFSFFKFFMLLSFSKFREIPVCLLTT